MTTVFTNVGEFRKGKGNRKTRLGPRVNISSVKNVGENRAISTPNSIAANKLRRLLEHTEVGKNRYTYASLVEHAEQIRFMNMPVLAEVFRYMYNYGIDLNPQNYIYNQTNDITPAILNYRNISDYIERLIPNEIREGNRSRDVTTPDLDITRLRLAATFLRYIQYIILLRQRAAIELEEARQRQTIIPPIIDEM